MTRGIIYLIINKETGHKYIDSTTLMMNKEWQNHIQESNRMSPKLIHRAFRHYGVEKFTIKEIDECEERLLEEKKYYWIERYKPEYNDPLPKRKPKIEESVESEPVKKKVIGRPFDKTTRGSGKTASIRIQGTNIKTGEIKEWESCSAAAEEITGNPKKNSIILTSARKGYVCYGYIWRLMEAKTRNKPVKGVHKITWVEVHYDSIKNAIADMGQGSKGAGLIKSLKSNGRYTWKGYRWYYV